jgi:hypothetical protein
MKMAGTAGLSITADLHVPEQGLAEGDHRGTRRLTGIQVPVHVGGRGDRYLGQGTQARLPRRQPYAVRVRLVGMS